MYYYAYIVCIIWCIMRVQANVLCVYNLVYYACIVCKYCILCVHNIMHNAYTNMYNIEYYACII